MLQLRQATTGDLIVSARLTRGLSNSFFLNLFNIYSLNTIRIEIQASNDYSSQNKIQEHFITQENMQQHEMQQIIIYLYK
jgi:spore coat polysaccharide biosynthesis protein SpsF (cytidylyltransferase family)